MRQDVHGLRDPRRLAAILILVVCGAAIAVWIIVRGDLVGADARAYWGGVRLWLGGGDPLDPPPPYMPYVYWSWSLPLFTPWAALPWETAWFVYRIFSVIVFLWSVTWAYHRHPLATALLVAVVTVPLAATLDTGNITLLCAMGIWAAHFVGPRLGGFMWALAAALKWFPLALFVVLPPRARLWGLAWGLLLAILTLAVWPESLRQLDLVIDYPRPIRLDYVLLLWAAVPWIWAHPRWFEPRTWSDQLMQARQDLATAVGRWWRSPGRVRAAWAALLYHGRRSLGLGEVPAGPAPAASAEGARAQPAGPRM